MKQVTRTLPASAGRRRSLDLTRTSCITVMTCALVLIRKRGAPLSSAGKLPGVVLGVVYGQVPDPVAVRFDHHDGALGQLVPNAG